MNNLIEFFSKGINATINKNFINIENNNWKSPIQEHQEKNDEIYEKYLQYVSEFKYLSKINDKIKRKKRENIYQTTFKYKNIKIIENNIFADRHIDNINDNFKGDMTIEDIIEGLNNLNNLNITKNDIIWNKKDLDKINDIFQKENDENDGHGIINIKFTDGQNIKFNINRNLNLNQIINNLNIGNVYIPKQIIKDFIPSKDWIFNKYSATSLWMALIMEFVGNSNKILSYFQKDMIPICTNSILSGDAKNTIADKSYIILNTDLSWKTELAVGKQYSFNSGQSIKISYIINNDNRIKIQDAIQNRNLTNLKTHNILEIKENIFEKNKDFFISKNITKQYVIDYLNVKEINNNYCIIDWLPGSDKFCGHNIEGIRKATENSDISDEESLKKYDLWIQPVKINFSFEKKEILELQENDPNFDSSIRDTVNNQDPQPSTSINNNIWWYSSSILFLNLITFGIAGFYINKFRITPFRINNTNNIKNELILEENEIFLSKNIEDNNINKNFSLNSKDEINSIDLQNQPSTSGHQPKSTQM